MLELDPLQDCLQGVEPFFHAVLRFLKAMRDSALNLITLVTVSDTYSYPFLSSLYEHMSYSGSFAHEQYDLYRHQYPGHAM